MKSWYLVLYDVRDSRRLQRTARILKGYGHRMQYSVFRCRLSLRDMERLRWEVARILEKEDDILFVPLCQSCIAKLRAADKRGDWPEDAAGFVVL